MSHRYFENGMSTLVEISDGPCLGLFLSFLWPAQLFLPHLSIECTVVGRMSRLSLHLFAMSSQVGHWTSRNEHTQAKVQN